MIEKDKLKGKKVRGTGKDRAKMAEAVEDLKLRKMAEFQAREAKRKRRGVKGAGKAANDKGPQTGAKKTKRKSNFQEEITNTKSAREFRHQPKKSAKKFNNKQKVYKSK